MGRAIVNIEVSSTSTKEELEQTLKALEELKTEILELLRRM